MDQEVENLIVNINQIIKDERTSQGVYQKYMAQEMGIVPLYYSQLEQNLRLKLSFRRYMEMSIVLNIPLHIIVQRVEDKSFHDIWAMKYNTSITFDDIDRIMLCMGAIFKEHRKNLDLSSFEVASHLGLAIQAFRYIENNTKKNTGMYRYIELSNLYNVPLHQVIKEAEKQVLDCKTL